MKQIFFKKIINKVASMGNLDAHLAESWIGVQQTCQQAKVTHTYTCRASNNNNIGIQQQHMVHEIQEIKLLLKNP